MENRGTYRLEVLMQWAHRGSGSQEAQDTGVTEW